MSAAKIVTLDVETSPLESYTWGLWEQNVGLEQIKTEWSILSYAAKWGDESRVICECTGGRGAAKVRDDKKLLKGVWEILDDADIVVAQNGRRFDLKKINARLIMAGFGPYSPVRVIDTLEVAKRHFAFTSSKLAWTSKYLTDSPKSEHRKFPGFELWAECLKDNPAAWSELKKYNKQDVIATWKYYLKLRPWIKSHPHIGVYADGDVHACAKCGSTKLQARGHQVTQASRYQRFQCQECGGWSRSKAMVSDKSVRKATLVSL